MGQFGYAQAPADGGQENILLDGVKAGDQGHHHIAGRQKGEQGQPRQGQGQQPGLQQNQFLLAQTLHEQQDGDGDDVLEQQDTDDDFT